MSTLPFIISYDGPHLHRSLLRHQDLSGMGLPPNVFLPEGAFHSPIIARHLSKPWQMAAPETDFGSTIKYDKDKFHITLDVHHFAPEEIKVKTVDDFVVVEVKHEEKKDEHGYISRQFTRKYALPEGCDPETVESSLSSDGVLSIIAPKVAAAKNVRNVPIAQTGPVRKEEVDQQATSESEMTGE